jgi:hypothetical chaperone protein
MTAEMRIELEDINIHEMLARDEFAHIIEDNLGIMLETMEEAERAAGLKPSDMDLVLTTGGTSLIPAIQNMLKERYGAERIKQRDTFTSVATGLSIVAQFA